MFLDQIKEVEQNLTGLEHFNIFFSFCTASGSQKDPIK